MDNSTTLNSVCFHILILVNKNMTRYKRTWTNFPRRLIQKQLREFYNIDVSISWIADCIGLMYKHGWLYHWQTPRRARGGTYNGSESRKQFPWKSVCYLRTRGIKIYQAVVDLGKRSWEKIKATIAATTVATISPEGPDQDLCFGRFGDPEFRRSKNWPAKPPPPKV